MLEPDPDIRASRKPEATERFSYLATAMERELREIELHVDSGSNGVDATLISAAMAFESPLPMLGEL